MKVTPVNANKQLSITVFSKSEGHMFNLNTPIDELPKDKIIITEYGGDTSRIELAQRIGLVKESISIRKLGPVDLKVFDLNMHELEKFI